MNLELPFGAPLVTVSLFAAAEIRSERLVGELAMRSKKRIRSSWSSDLES